MTPQYSPTSRPLVLTVSALIWLTAATVSPQNTPTPTPPTGSLAAYASTVKLAHTAAADADGRVTLTNDNLGTLAAEGAITLGAAATNAGTRARSKNDGSASERARWRTAYRKQQTEITDLERRRALLEIEIKHIEDQKLDVRNLARLERAESKRRQLEAQIAAERSELARIVRQARRHGAEPGWFR
jgi:septal ring factor EnvC (AmiA/AmiB activator)